jgi:RNA polymerase sigma-70 factor (sigma-E family)
MPRTIVRDMGAHGGKGDPPALVEFCRRMHPQLVGTLTLYCGSRMVAEELAQEALIRVWDRWETVSALNSPAGWAHHVALNLARSWSRRRAAERRAHARAGMPDAVARETLDAEDVLVLRQAVASLPPRQRAVVAWRFYADLSVEETAGVLGCAPGTVKSLTHKAVAALRRDVRFSDVEVTPRGA